VTAFSAVVAEGRCLLPAQQDRRKQVFFAHADWWYQVIVVAAVCPACTAAQLCPLISG
jgi:hypothetical protein